MAWDTRTGGGSAARTESAFEALLLNYADAVGPYLSTHLIRYVDPVNGNDANTGLSPASAHLTIPHAYADLKAVAIASFTGVLGVADRGIGRIQLLPGTHTLTSGQLWDATYPVELYGMRSGRYSHVVGPTSSMILMSSTSATYFFRMHGTGVGHGFRFKDVSFAVDPTAVTGNVALTSVLNPDSIDDWIVEDCSCDTTTNATNLNIPFIKHENTNTGGNADAAWFRVRNNHVANLALYSMTGQNGNRFRIHDNVCFYGGTIAHVTLAGDTNGGLLDGNNFEGAAVAIEIGPTGTKTQTTFLNNSGEDATSGVGNPFYLFSGAASQCIIIGGTCAAIAGSAGALWIEYRHASAFNNLAIGPWDYTGVAGQKRRILDSSTSNGNRLINLNSGPLIKVKTGVTNPTITDSDFAPTPMDGTQALTVATGTNETRLWVRANGVWTPLSNQAGAVSTTTPGAVTTVNIAHGLGAAPTAYSAHPGNANARGAPTFFLTADATNVILTFASALTAGTSYSWVWLARR